MAHLRLTSVGVTIQFAAYEVRMSIEPSQPGKRPCGFTLVELLVVIGIIAVLIGILLPTLSRAREAGNRAACLSNMKQVYTFLKMYENANKGASPLGTGGDAMQAAYFLTRGGAAFSSIPLTSIRYVGLGLIIPAGVVKSDVATGQSGRIFYCPSFVGDVNHDFNSTSNPWPPSNPFYDGATVPAHGCRMSYSQRPILLPEPKTGGGFRVMKIQYDKDSPQWSPQHVPRGWPTAGGVTPLVPPLYQFPKLNKLKSAAIFSDVNAGEGRLKVGHRKGLNVLYNNGSAKYVDLSYGFDFGSVYKESIKQLIEKQTGFGTPHDPTQIQLWMVLDRQ